MNLQAIVATSLCAGLLACAPAQPTTPNKHQHTRPLSVEEHQAEAERHNAVAQAEEAAYQPEGGSMAPSCGSDPVEGQSRIGDEPVRFAHPCFTSVTSPTAMHLKEAVDNRREAKKHRESAAALLEAEAASCAGLDDETMSHSPFYHREDILEVKPLRIGGAPRGAFVAFRKVRGLSRVWMERALTCHQARAAVLGFADTFMPYCLASVRGATVSVTDTGDRLIVSVRGPDDRAGAAIWSRAHALEPAEAKTK